MLCLRSVDPCARIAPFLAAAEVCGLAACNTLARGQGIRADSQRSPLVRNDGYVDTCDESQFAYLLSYLAGTHHLARESALATIKNWHVEAIAFSQYN